MTITRCDICDQEITEKNKLPVHVKMSLTSQKVDSVVIINFDAMNNVDICRYCASNLLDDREHRDKKP